jgi:CRP-like cAMP-binding protein
MFLDVLPASEREQLWSRLVEVQLPMRQTLFWPGEPITYVYFPIDGLVSSLALDHGGGMVGVGVIGREGMVGLGALLGARSSPHWVTSQVPGHAWRLAAESLRELATPQTEFFWLLLRYTHAVLVQAAQSAACNRLHPLRARAARWLATCRDRLGADEFPLTQEFLAGMLGVRRAGVTEALAPMKRAGLLEYRRGWIRILDPERLEAAACDCYQIVRDELLQVAGARLLDPPAGSREQQR